MRRQNQRDEEDRVPPVPQDKRDGEKDDGHPTSPRGQERYYMEEDGKAPGEKSTSEHRFRDQDDYGEPGTARKSPYQSYGGEDSDRLVDTDKE